MTTRKEYLMNPVLPLLNGHVDAKQTALLLFTWAMQILAIVGLALMTKARESARSRDK